MKSVMNLPTKRNKSNFKAGLGMLKFDHITITNILVRYGSLDTWIYNT